MQKKKGISLIVLVITIIVMVILAGAIILILNNSGIISKASEAVEETNLATVKEVASLAWAEAYADGVRTVEDLADGTKGFETRIKEAFEKNKIDTEKYKLNITTSGVEVKLLSNIWVKDGFTVVKGDKVLEIGDVVNYDETAGGSKTGLTATEWKVLGVNEEGNLLLMSTVNVTTKSLGDETGSNLEKSQQDWLHAPSLLDAECEAYGYGEGVIGKARSITVEDVNAVTGYDPTMDEDYGKEITYSWNTISGDTFTWYDEETGTFPSVARGDTTTPLPTIKKTGYSYNVSVIENEKACSMIYDTDNTMYWLATTGVFKTSEIWYGVFEIAWGSLSMMGTWGSNGESQPVNFGVRAVVTLQSDITLTGSSETGWSYTVN